MCCLPPRSNSITIHFRTLDSSRELLSKMNPSRLALMRKRRERTLTRSSTTSGLKQTSGTLYRWWTCGTRGWVSQRWDCLHRRAMKYQMLLPIVHYLTKPKAVVHFASKRISLIEPQLFFLKMERMGRFCHTQVVCHYYLVHCRGHQALILLFFATLWLLSNFLADGMLWWDRLLHL